MGKVAVVGGTASKFPSDMCSKRSFSRALTPSATDVAREVIDAIVKRGNYEVTILSRRVYKLKYLSISNELKS